MPRRSTSYRPSFAVTAIVAAWLLLVPFDLMLTVTGMAINSILFSKEDSGKLSDSQQSPLVIFLHGRLEAEPGETAYPPPNKLYGDFIERLRKKLPSDGTGLLLLEFDEILSKLSTEPRDLRLGPISSAISESICNVIAPETSQQHKKTLTLITFSMGAAMGLKLLNTGFSERIEKVVLIEPVWRCWLPFAVSSPKIICDVPTLALAGSKDKDTMVDSGRSVQRSLKPFLPNLEVVELKGGNHWCILNDEFIISKEGLAPNKTPGELQNEMVENIACFCNWDDQWH